MMKEEEVGKLRLNKIEKNVTFEDEHGKIVIKRKDVKHLMVKNGDVFVLKQFEGLTTDLVDQIVESISSIGLKDSVVVVVPRLSDLRTLGEEQMNAYGWFRQQAG
jgi:hypothetical protein